MPLLNKADGLKVVIAIHSNPALIKKASILVALQNNKKPDEQKTGQPIF